MKTRHRILLTSSLAAVILAADWALLHRDWKPLAWHLRHGYHIQSNGLQFTVPLLYGEDHGAQANKLAFYQFPGRFSRKTAAITVQFNKGDSPESMGDAFIRRERSAHLGERPGRCVEYVANVKRHFANDRFQFDMLAPDAPTYIYCSFGENLRASFVGGLDASDDFYAFIADAENVNRK